MIEYAKGNILQADTEALVNTVNCVGYMGKGIALQFKQAYPENFRAYEKACRAKAVQPGRMFVFETGRIMPPQYIINFPTKRHWRDKSRIEDIKSGLVALTEEVQCLGLHSIAVPPLGCGNGGLNWSEVRPLIESAFASLPDVRVLLYAPHGAPDAKTMPIGTDRQKMTASRALLVKLIEQYTTMAYRLTLLEIQKLAYFLQEAGEPLQLRYEAGTYGPYAPNLNKVLERLEGHFIRGYGDSQKRDTEISLLSEAVEEADTILADQQASLTRLQRISDLIEGFETPYGMELLSSVHRVTRHVASPVTDPADAVVAVHNWNQRKRSMFKPSHITTAWQRLQEQGWLM
jgi:O-acetyl-ADP-ribose deacetylase (regulator of RNase III)